MTPGKGRKSWVRRGYVCLPTAGMVPPPETWSSVLSSATMASLGWINLLLLVVFEGCHNGHHRQAVDASDMYALTVLHLKATVQMPAE